MSNIVLDTNCLLMSLNKRSPYFKIWEDFKAGKFTLCFSTEILMEYEEIIAKKTSPEIASNIITAILTRANTRKLDVTFKFQLIESDLDDNKFVDCAIRANAKYIVTQDHHYDVLKTIDFPKVNVIDIDSFLEFLKQ